MAAGTDVIGSAADLISSVDFSGTAIEPGDSGESPIVEGDNPEGLSEGESAEEPFVEPEEAVADDVVEEPVAEEPVVDPNTEGLPDGVRRGKDRSGKDGLWLTPQRYEQFHAAHRTLRDFEGAIGEAITPESLELRDRAYQGQERLYADLTSAEPETQGKVLSHFIDEAQRAFQDGEVGSDPVVPMATMFYDTLRAKSPDAFAHLRMKAGNDLIGEMYQYAQQTGDKNLALSASHIAKALGVPYKQDAEISDFLAARQVAADPTAQLRAENQRLQEQINGRQSENATAQFNSWKNTTKQSVTTAVREEAVLGSLAEERKSWEQFPSQFDNLVVGPLNKAVHKAIAQDAKFNERIARLDQQAMRATSAQVRANISGDIRSAFIQRARLAVEASKAGILREAATLLEQNNNATHQRRQAAQQQRGPRGAQAPAPKSLIPDRPATNPGGTFDPKAEAARLRQYLG